MLKSAGSTPALRQAKLLPGVTHRDTEIHNVYFPVTLMVARRVADGRYQDLIAWLREGEQLATDFPGYLGSGVLAPPPGDNEFQIIFRFVDEQTLHAWEHSASRTAWLDRGSDLFAHPKEHRVSGIEGWFGTSVVGQRPPRWKQAIAICWHSFRCRCCSILSWVRCSWT